MKRLKTFLFSFLLAALSIVFIAGCSTDTSSSNLGGGSSSGTDNGGSPTKPNVTPVNEFPANPFALLGVYDITSQSVNGTSQEVTAGSEFRVNVSTTKLVNENPAVDVLVRIIINGKTVDFTREISLVGETLGAEFFEKVFTDMGAKVTGEYTLEFTLAGTKYTEIVDDGIIGSGDTLVINLDKTKDLDMDAGLDDSTETPETPSEPVKVESIQITTPDKPYYTGSTVTIDFTLNPSNTTETEVTYQTTNNGSGTITAVNGKGQLVLKNVTQSDTVIFIIANNQQASFNIDVVNEVESISFLNATEKIEQNQTRIIAIENYDVIKDAFSSITYSVVDGTKANINSTTGEVTGLKNGVTQVNVTATRLDGQQLTASYELDVVGLVDFTNNNTFKESAQGTYNITFFGTSPGEASGGSDNAMGFMCGIVRGQTDVPVTNDCGVFEKIFGAGKCTGTTFANEIVVAKDKLAGRMTITIDSNGSALIHTKVLMTHADIIKNSQNDQYQYTVYRPTLGTNAMNNQSSSPVTDMKGRNLTAEGEWTGSTFEVKIYENNSSKTIQLYSQMMNKVISAGGCNNMSINPRTYIIAEKISSKVETMGYSDVTSAPFNSVTGVTPAVSDLGDTIPSY